MSDEDYPDIADSWVEVTPQSLGYPSAINDVQADQQGSFADLGTFHTNVDERLMAHLLSEAQDHSDRVSEAAPPSPPPSRDVFTPSEPSESNPIPQAELLYAAAVRAAALNLSLTTDWTDRPEAEAFMTGGSGSSNSESFDIRPWFFRNSVLMKSGWLAWLLDHIPSFLTHAASFLLGAAAMFFFLRKRVNWSKIMAHLPLD